MTDDKARARQRAVNYMARLLQMNPFQAADEIIGTRTAALGLAKKGNPRPAPDDMAQPREERRKLIEQLEKLRTEFWTLPLDTLQAKLRDLRGKNFPDVEAAAARLQVLAAHRAEFPKLAALRDFNGELFSALKQIFVSSPREVTVLKERVLSTFRNRSYRKRGRRMVKLLKKQMPAVYELEADWFRTLYRQKAKAPEVIVSGGVRTPISTSSDSGNYWWLIGFVAFIVVKVLIRLASRQ